jgi:hypothetical protein
VYAGTRINWPVALAAADGRASSSPDTPFGDPAVELARRGAPLAPGTRRPSSAADSLR